MQNRTQIFAACALPVMMGMALLAGCEGQSPVTSQSQMSVKQLDKASTAIQNAGKNNNTVTPVANKPGTGTVSFKIVGLAARRVLYSRTDIQSMLIFLQNMSGGADAQRTVTGAEITANTQTFTMNNVSAGDYIAFVTVSSGANPLTDPSINFGGAPAQSAQFTVTEGNTVSPSVAVQLADTPTAVGTVGAQIVITDGN